MGLVFHLICLFFTLFVLQSYVSSGFHAREHRLLPLVLGLIALNSFLSHYLLCYGRGKDTSYTDRFTGHSHAVSYDSLCG